MINIGFTEMLFALLAILLVVAAVLVVRTFTISNGLTATVALLAPIYWWSIGLPLWPGQVSTVWKSRRGANRTSRSAWRHMVPRRRSDG